MKKAYDKDNIPFIENQIINLQNIIDSTQNEEEKSSFQKVKTEYENSLQKLKDYHNIA